MDSSKKILLSTVGIAVLVVLLSGITFAFFNYTRTGVVNTIRVGRISFVTRQTETINLTNIFPIASSEATGENPNYDSVVIEIEGDTDYNEGIEYLVSAVDANIYTSSGQTIPISLDITVDGLGTENANYFNARESKNATIYKKIVGDTLVGDQMLLVGYIAPNDPTGTADGIDGSITIKAYLDENNILISDTYDGTESDNMGTPNSLAEGKTVLTTTEWNALSSSGISFKVKVEANEGIWVVGSLEEIMRKSAVIDNINSDYVDNETPGINFGAISSNTNGKGVYTRAGTENDDYPIMYYRGEVEDNNVVFNNKCWKAVRTTDTGGVKLIYNGELSDTYISGEKIARSSYTNVVTPASFFAFDSTDNSWNVTITDSSFPSISFTVPAGDNYSLVMTGTSGPTTGGSYNFYKNDSSVSNGGGGGGTPFASTYSYGTLTADDVIKFDFLGSGTTSSPLTFKLIMQQNGSAIPRSSYTLIGETFTYDDTTQKWSSSVALNKIGAIEFNVNEPGDYFINYTNPGYGKFNIYRNGVAIDTKSGTAKGKLFNLQPTDKILISYSHKNTAQNGEVEFYVSNAENIGLGCDNIGEETVMTLNNTNLFKFAGAGMILSPSYVGYMRGTDYEYSKANWTSGAYFGSGFTWDGENYKLTDATVTTPNDTHHYSCNQPDPNATCQSIRFVYWLSSGNNKYYITISNGMGIEEAIQDMQANRTSSNAKTQIDTWYENNMIGVTNKLEDTIWCNDRSIGKVNGWSETGTINGTWEYRNYSILFGAHERSNNASDTSTVKNQPSLVCLNKNDRFTVNNRNGNRDLTYPIAMLTEDEAVLAGGLPGNESYYLNSNLNYLSMSPYSFVASGFSDLFLLGFLSGNVGTDSDCYIRPAISIKPGQLITKGLGTVYNPYVIE